MMSTFSGGDVLAALSDAVARLAADAAPSIVQVHGRPRGPASGFVVGPERVLTTSHSVEREEGVKVRTNDGQVHAAQVAGHDDTTDLALLKVQGLGVSPLQLSTDPVRAGNLVAIVGRSWRGTPQLRLAVVGSVAGPLQSSGGGRLDEVLGLAVGVYGGFSGSAVLGVDGRVVGVATAGILRASSLAVPAAIVRRVVGDLEQHGGIRRGYLGISTHPVRLPDHQRSAVSSDRALLIIDVGSDTPAAKSGLLVGDVLVRFDGAPIADADTLLAALGPDRVNTEVPVTVLRGAIPTEVRVKIEQRPRR